MLKWQKGKGINPAENPAHKSYLTLLCETMVDAVAKKIVEVSGIMEEETRNKTYVEVLYHSMYGHKRIQRFMVRITM